MVLEVKCVIVYKKGFVQFISGTVAIHLFLAIIAVAAAASAPYSLTSIIALWMTSVINKFPLESMLEKLA